MRDLLLTHAKRYSLMEEVDFAKLIYQSAFAGGHLIASPEYALNRLKSELDALPDQPRDPLVERIGGGLSRLYLAPSRRMGLRAETIAGLFIQTAARFKKDAALFESGMTELEALCLQGEINADPCAVRRLRDACRRQGYPPFSHSERYHVGYAPAYRLVSNDLLRFTDVFAAIDARLSEKGSVRVAIDGCCAAGKTTLASYLDGIYGAQLFHMDDFFLPFERKTPQRLAQPGGNVDYERFQSDILNHLNEPRFSYRPYLCHEGALGAVVETEKRAVQIIEGSYSLHPAMNAEIDVRIFLSLNAQEQSRRLLVRNGEAMHRRFMTEWVPMENRYFEAFSIPASCDIVYIS